jgi:hypothetical protein
MNKPYDFNEHKHRYSVWTAARAVQRKFTTTNNISKAIDKSGLRRFSETEEVYTSNQYDIEQYTWCGQLIEAFEEMGVACSYGQAAKIVAIYLKTAVVLPGNGKSLNAQVIHPPIDSILIKAISAFPELSHLKNKRWTKFSFDDYVEVIGPVRAKFGKFDWTLEEYWKPQDEEIKEELSAL